METRKCTPLDPMESIRKGFSNDRQASAQWAVKREPGIERGVVGEGERGKKKRGRSNTHTQRIRVTVGRKGRKGRGRVLFFFAACEYVYGCVCVSVCQSADSKHCRTRMSSHRFIGVCRNA